MSRDHHSGSPAKKQRLNYSNDVQTHTGEKPGHPMLCKYIKQEVIEESPEFEEVNEHTNPPHDEGPDGESEGIPKEININEENSSADNAETARRKPGIEDTFIKPRIILEEKYENPLEELPADWVKLPHASGMPVYLHLSTRVCTLSKPYYIGKVSVRLHNIPMGAIPCYAYRRSLEEEAAQKIRDQEKDEQVHNSTQTTGGKSAATQKRTPQMPKPMIEGIRIKQEVIDDEETDVQVTNEGVGDGQGQTNASEEPPSSLQQPANHSWVNQQLTPEQVNNYCKTLFHFTTKNYLYFRTWAARRHYLGRKTLQGPKVPQVTVSVEPAVTDKHTKRLRLAKLKLVRDLSKTNPSYTSLFYEYVRRVLHIQPKYEYTELENPITPYQTTVYIGDKKYGVGEGHNKREAKSAASRASIYMLVPELPPPAPDAPEVTVPAPPPAPALVPAPPPAPALAPTSPAAPAPAAEPDYSLFDCMSIEDPSVTKMSLSAGQPTPYAVLRICLFTNFGIERRINVQVIRISNQKTKLTMKVGKYTTIVICRNQKIGKQRASQNILQKLHPEVRSWGSLLRLYGLHSDKGQRAGRQVCRLQRAGPAVCARRRAAAAAVLRRLRAEMRALTARDSERPAHTASNLNILQL